MHSVYVTVDVDWAPDWAMERLLEVLVKERVRSTWFITHESALLVKLRQHPDLVDLGIHPNFLPGSSHGSSTSQVLSECMRMVPEARTMRTHCLVQSTAILQAVVAETPIELDTSLYLRGAMGVDITELPLAGRSLTRVPYVWEDDLEFFARDPRWDGAAFVEERAERPGITIVDLHPIHVALNSSRLESYASLKAITPDLRSVSEEEAGRYTSREPGAATFLDSLILACRAMKVQLDQPLTRLIDRSAPGTD